MASRIHRPQDGVPGAECSSQSSGESESAELLVVDENEAKQTVGSPPQTPPRRFVREAAKRVQGTLESLQQWAVKPNPDSVNRDGSVTPDSPEEDQVSASFLRAFSSCAGFDTTDARNCVGMTVHESMDEIRHVFRRPRVPSEDMTQVSEEGDSQQLHRLASWNTIQSNYTTGTTYTAASGRDPSNGRAASNGRALDDDGNPIDPKLLERRARAASRTKRKRVVQFDYPPISSLRQCPRPDPNDLPQLFFTESELDQLEEDRFSTYVADDVEIVAVSTSASEEPTKAATQVEPETPRPNHFDYVPTPHTKRATFFDNAQPSKEPQQRKSRRPATPGRRASTRSEAVPVKEKRLIKSVQIYLRERSTQA